MPSTSETPAVALLSFFLCALVASAQQPRFLPNTAPIPWPEEDLSGRLMDGAHAFVERKIAESATDRARFWSYDTSSPEACQKSIAPNRARFREIIGLADERLPPDMERYGNDDNPALVAESEAVRVYQVRWPVLENFSAEGLLVEPKGEALASLVAIPDAGQTPEDFLGIGGDAPTPVGKLAASGFRIVIPTLVSLEKVTSEDESENSKLRKSDQTRREWIYRQAFHMGRHLIGYEVQQVLAAVDGFEKRYPGRKIGVLGHGEGGLIAFYAAAVDPRIDVALVSGYFDSRQKVWSEPIYRNVWGLLREFGDAEIASLITGRTLIVEHSAVDTVRGHKGEIVTPEFASVRAEFDRIPSSVTGTKKAIVSTDGGMPVTPAFSGALRSFLEEFRMGPVLLPVPPLPPDRRKTFNSATREDRLFRAIETHVQSLVRASEHIRDDAFLFTVNPGLKNRKWTTDKQLPTGDAGTFATATQPWRDQLYDEVLGRFDEPLLPLNPRTRLVAETGHWTAYDVVLDVYPELIAWGVIVIPKNIAPGEKRPVVVCQHGRNGIPRDTIDNHTTAYNDFAGKLAERGFITFAPHNLYRGEDRYRWLDRKANNVKASLWSFIIPQHSQILDWLATLPVVDPERIAFYGLSFGGESAVRIPTILHDKYCLSICSGDFNQWTRKVASTDQPFSFMFSIEWELPHWNMGHTFDYAELSYLMIPRPFMVERGHLDGVGRDQWVAHEYAKTRWLYAQLGLVGKTEIEFFQGGHSINGEGTFSFLHKHLDWPEPEDALE